MTSLLRLGTPDTASLRAQVDEVVGKLSGERVAGADLEALARGDVDAILAPLAALAGSLGSEIELVAVPKRADARDALVSVGGLRLADLPSGARVGVDSARRRAQLQASRSDLEVVVVSVGLPFDGDAVGLDAAIVAVADLDGSEGPEVLSLSDWPTSPAQGALGIAVRRDAPDALRRRLARLDHRPTRLAASAELAVLTGLRAAPTAPVAAYALLDDGLLFVSATVYAPDGSDSVTASHAAYPEDSKDPAVELGSSVAAELIERAAAELAPELAGDAS